MRSARQQEASQVSIDWITVLAQVGNFLLLVWLLKRFLYQPILNGIAAREAEIARRLEQATLAREKAETAEQQYLSSLAQTRAGQEEAVASALEQSAEQREQMLRRARKQVEHERQEWQAYLEREREEFVRHLQLTAHDTLLATSQRMVQELADEQFELLILRHLRRQLQSIARELVQAAGTSQEIEVSTRYELPDDSRQQVIDILQELFVGAVVNFRIRLEQSPGVMVHVGGVEVSWTLDSYAEELAREFREQYARTAGEA